MFCAEKRHSKILHRIAISYVLCRAQSREDEEFTGWAVTSVGSFYRVQRACQRRVGCLWCWWGRSGEFFLQGEPQEKLTEGACQRRVGYLWCWWGRFWEFFFTGRATGESLQRELVRGVWGAWSAGGEGLDKEIERVLRDYYGLIRITKEA